MFCASHQAGQGLTKYLFLLVFVAIAILLILTLMGGQIGNVFSQIVTCLRDPGTSVNNLSSIHLRNTPQRGAFCFVRPGKAGIPSLQVARV